jgi:hypothetical protein
MQAFVALQGPATQVPLEPQISPDAQSAGWPQ